MRFFLTVIALFCLEGNLLAQTYEEMLSRAMDYVEKKDWPAAEQALKAVLKKEPANQGNTLLLVNLGTVQRNLGKLDEALVSYNVALAKFPNQSFLLHNRAALYCEMDKMDNALLDYGTILINNPNDIEALYRRGLILLSKKNLPAAEDDFKKIDKIDPDNVWGKSGLALILKRRERWADAEELYTYMIYKNKTNGELYFNRAECYLQLDKLAKTQEDITKAAEYGFDNASLYILRGQLRLAQFDRLSAKNDFLKAKEMGVNDSIVDVLIRTCH